MLHSVQCEAEMPDSLRRFQSAVAVSMQRCTASCSQSLSEGTSHRHSPPTAGELLCCPVFPTLVFACVYRGRSILALSSCLLSSLSFTAVSHSFVPNEVGFRKRYTRCSGHVPSENDRGTSSRQFQDTISSKVVTSEQLQYSSNVLPVRPGSTIGTRTSRGTVKSKNRVNAMQSIYPAAPGFPMVTSNVSSCTHTPRHQNCVTSQIRSS